MRFELDELLIDDIIFFMENQDGDFLIDTQEGHVVNLNNYEDEYDEEPDFEDEKFINLPEWSSADGYRLMERFAAGLKKPVLREELSRALNRNHGVFRAFRDVLALYPETEKQWYAFKNKEMKNEVIDWYNSLREEWGLEPIGSEPEDNTDLVHEDFVIKEQRTENSDKSGVCITAETASGELAGTVSAEIIDSKLQVKILEVKSEYRGMGIGKTLLEKILEKADKENLEVIIDLPSESDFFSRTLHLERFEPCMQRFLRKI